MEKVAFWRWLTLGLLVFTGSSQNLYSSHTASGSEYDYYVREGESGDGSKDHPFGSIKDAIEAISGKKNQKIFVSKGTYSAGLTLPKDTTLVGSDAKSVLITGPWILSDGVRLTGLGFSGSGNIVVTKNASVTFETLRFKDISGPAVKTEPGNAKLVMSDSTIENARKGMYLQAGTTISLRNVTVSKSREEGVDIRENVSGSIRSSEFLNNKESGIELVLGSANLEITGSSFSQNGASGIAAQFFDGAKKLGNVRIEENTFSKNEWGVNCKSPQGNMDSKFYFLNSITAKRNTFQGNKLGEIAPTCKIMTDEERAAYEKKEAAQKALAEEQRSLTLSETDLTERLAQAVDFRKAATEKRLAVERARIDPVLASIDIALREAEAGLVLLGSSRSGLTCYLSGTAKSDRTLTYSLNALDQFIAQLEDELSLLDYPSHQLLVQEKINAIKITRENIQKALDSPRCAFSLFGWVNRLFVSDAPLLFGDIHLETITLVDTRPERAVLFLGTIGYYPKVREVAVRAGDKRLVESLSPVLERYSMVMGDLHFPLGTEVDPVPASLSEASFPVRFASIFSGVNMRWFHFGHAYHIETNQALWEKSVANLTYAEAEVLSQVNGAKAERTVWLGNKKLHWIDYRETSGMTREALHQRVDQLQQHDESVIVVVGWDERRGSTLTPKREEFLRDIAAMGVSLVIGTGIVAPFEHRMIDTTPVYFSLGSAFENFQLGDTTKKSVALEIKISPEGKLEVAERNLVFTAEKGLELLP